MQTVSIFLFQTFLVASTFIVETRDVHAHLRATARGSIAIINMSPVSYSFEPSQASKKRAGKIQFHAALQTPVSLGYSDGTTAIKH